MRISLLQVALVQAEGEDFEALEEFEFLFNRLVCVVDVVDL